MFFEAHVVLGLAEVLRVLLQLLIVLVAVLDLIHFFFAQKVQIYNGFNDRDGGCRDGVEVLDQLPLTEAACEDIKALNHLVAIRQVQVGHRHVHVTRLKCQPSHQGAKLLYPWC